MPVSKCIFHSNHLVRLRYKFIAVRCSFLSLRRLHGLRSARWRFVRR